MNYIYEGTAYPVHWGGKVERDNPVYLTGRFHTEDFQDGLGPLLTNEHRGELMGWVVASKDRNRIKYSP